VDRVDAASLVGHIVEDHTHYVAQYLLAESGLCQLTHLTIQLGRQAKAIPAIVNQLGMKSSDRNEPVQELFAGSFVKRIYGRG